MEKKIFIKSMAERNMASLKGLVFQHLSVDGKVLLRAVNKVEMEQSSAVFSRAFVGYSGQLGK